MPMTIPLFWADLNHKKLTEDGSNLGVPPLRDNRLLKGLTPILLYHNRRHLCALGKISVAHPRPGLNSFLKRPHILETSLILSPGHKTSNEFQQKNTLCRQGPCQRNLLHTTFQCHLY